MIKVEMPSIDWSHIHPDYKWLAVCNDGLGFLYKAEPNKEGDSWVDWRYAWLAADGFKSYKRGNVAWDKSLVKRPEGV